ncbi:MAG: hypothetical protein WC809_14915 [Sinimarinibacterium sp.]|jgi:hypothetical protein
MNHRDQEAEVERMRAMFEAQLEAREHEIGTTFNMSVLLRGFIMATGSKGLAKTRVARIRAEAREQIRRTESGLCGCSKCLAQSNRDEVSTRLLNGS